MRFHIASLKEERKLMTDIIIYNYCRSVDFWVWPIYKTADLNLLKSVRSEMHACIISDFTPWGCDESLHMMSFNPCAVLGLKTMVISFEYLIMC